MMRILSMKKAAIVITLLTVVTLTAGCSHRQERSLIEQHKYDNEGRLVCKIASDGSKTEYKYNNQGLPVKIKYQGGWVRYDYNEEGNRIWMKDKTGTTEYYYDAFDRLIGVIWKHSPWQLIVYNYDPRGYLNYMAIFDLRLMEQDLKYRDMLRELKRDISKRAQWHNREFKFNQMMQRLSLEDAVRKQRWLQYEVKYRHDILGNLTSIDTKGGCIKYSYHPDKGQIERRLPNGITTRFTYAPDSLLKSLRHENSIGQHIAEYRYNYNAAGKVINVHELTSEGLKTTGYIWDTRGYLKELHLPGGNRIRYDYNAMGNRILKQDVTETLRYEYDKFGRLAQAENFRYEWNRNGNLISQMEGENRTRIKYDGRNLPTFVKIPDATIRYDWDGDGNMISRGMGKDITHYLPNPIMPSSFTLAEFDKTGRLTSSYLYGDVLLGQQDMKGQMRYFLEDGFNSIRHITDMKGKIVGQRDYTPFAKPLATKGDIPVNFRTMGERFLPEIKSYVIGGRLYEPNVGRYFAPDPFSGYIGRFDSFNKYAHGCNASGIFTEPRCNQTKKGNITLQDWGYEKFGIFGMYLPGKRETHYQYTPEWIMQNIGKDLISKMAKSVWGPEIAILPRFYLGVVEPWSKQYGRQIYGGPPLTWEDMEGYAKAGLGIIGGTLGIPFLAPPGPQGKYTGLFLGEMAANIGRFYGTRIDRPYWWWSPMKWIPQEEYLRGGAGVSGLGEHFGGRLNDPFKSIENQLGGIELAATGEFIGNLGNITGAVYDPEKECLILLGDKDLPVPVPSIKAEDLAVALMSVFGPIPQDPQFSLDPDDPRNPRGKWLKAVYIPEEVIEGTSLGKAMFEADWLLKQYSFGVRVDENGKLQERKSPISGFKSTVDLSLEQKKPEYGKERWARFWIVSDDMRLKKNGNSIYFDAAIMRVKAKKQVPDPSSPTGLRDIDTQDDPIATKFATLFTELYDEIARESPEFERVRELAKAVALAKWIKEENIPVDMDWVVEYANKRIKTAGKIAALSVQWQKQQQRPYSKGNRTGIQTIIHQLHLFGGVDLTVNPRYVSDDGGAQSLQEAVRSKLREKDVKPFFTIENNGKTLQAVVLPITKNGQEMWKNSPSIEIDGVKYQFNNEGELTKRIDKSGNITEYAYDSNHMLKTVKISNGNGWKIVGERNENGSLWIANNPRGNTFKYKYGGSGYLNEIEVDGHRWATYESDQERREVITRYNGYTERIAYDESGKIRGYEITTELETEKLAFDYDKFGNLTNISGTDVPSVNISYTEDGIRPVKITTPQAETQYLYDADRRIKHITHSSGFTATYAYDGEQLMKVQIDYQGRQAEYWFDANGIVQSSDLLGGIADYGYTKRRLSSVKLAQYGEANYVYDDQNRLREVLLPDGSRMEYQYEEEKGREGKANGSQWRATVVTHPATTYKLEHR